MAIAEPASSLGSRNPQGPDTLEAVAAEAIPTPVRVRMMVVGTGAVDSAKPVMEVGYREGTNADEM